MNHSIRVSLDAWLPTEIHDEQLIRLTAASDRNIVKKTQKYFARSFLGRRKILNARRYMMVYMNACI
ncbi:hypothetical protein ALC53_12260 [Atta colombica]|uniref:Uncharacterized protein n=1 Tax=Atta colombica TaxID=520822 RepID=A0A195AZ94_9HYME|nr:hypothetical protein ALC53_12260 [Atta colombica]